MDLLRGPLGALLVSLALACGGAAGGPSPQVAPAPSGSEATEETPPSGPGAPAPSESGSTMAPPGLTPGAPPVEMKGPIPTAMQNDLLGLGIDPKNLPPIEKLEPRTLRAVMKLFTKSLGIKCGGCHQEGDYAAPTRRKRIAAHMWNEFAAKLTLADGTPLFCDSCHQGRVVQLDRRDKKALSQWMDQNFVTGLARKDGKENGCETCHVDMEMRFLANWAAN